MEPSKDSDSLLLPKFNTEIWVYEQISEHIVNLINNKPFENLRKAQNILKIDARTIDIYSDTYVSYKNFFFFTKEIKDPNIIINNYKNLNTIGLVNYLPKKIWAYLSDGPTLDLVNNKPFNTIKEASLFIGSSRSTIINILDRNIAVSKGFYCFTKELSETEKTELKTKGIIRNQISSLSKTMWVYTRHNNNIILFNNKPFQSQQEMLRILNLKRIRTINKYKDTGVNFKGYYFFSKKLEPAEAELEKLKTNVQYAKLNRKSMLVWAYKNNQLINNSPFLSMSSAGKELKLNRKLIRKYLDSNIPYEGYLFFSNSLNT